MAKSTSSGDCLVSRVSWIRCKTAALKTKELNMNAPSSNLLGTGLSCRNSLTNTSCFPPNGYKLPLPAMLWCKVFTISRILELDILASSQMFTTTSQILLTKLTVAIDLSKTSLAGRTAVHHRKQCRQSRLNKPQRI